ncbi:histidyl-tRNA synthetase [Helicosporidium sp. ATCC 50920]|nr:histidyl-tRNA synthetase [Helicosporidium sp. ATCC 50920]|eukprot:KDD74905.1 histidyl-tRNA synthetase [Helicosporidium sp. ATCC 50920]
MRTFSTGATGEPGASTSGSRLPSGVSARPPAAKEAISLQPPRGTRDFLPEEKRLQSWLFAHWWSVSEAFGYDPVDYPLVESEALFLRKAGEDISEQLYAFADRSGRRLALRPELTPSLARLAAASRASHPLPLKWAAVGQCWRYERAGRGRRREHYQWNLDVLGIPGPAPEAELLAALASFFKRVGLTPKDVRLKVSSRQILAAALEAVGGASEALTRVAVVVDRAEKLGPEAVLEALEEQGLEPRQSRRLLFILDAPDLQELCSRLKEGCGSEQGGAGAGSEECGNESESLSSLSPLGRAAVSELERLWELARSLGVAEWLDLSPKVVRGLAYYTGVVFEGVDARGELRSICGGGRYDRLLGTLGGEDAPCAGFGLGDAVVVELLRERGLLPDFKSSRDVLVGALEEGDLTAAAGVADRLRATRPEARVDLALQPRRPRWLLKHAEKQGARVLVVVGGEEWSRGALRVRDLTTGHEREVSVDQLVHEFEQ